MHQNSRILEQKSSEKKRMTVRAWRYYISIFQVLKIQKNNSGIPIQNIQQQQTRIKSKSINKRRSTIARLPFGLLKRTSRADETQKQLAIRNT